MSARFNSAQTQLVPDAATKGDGRFVSDNLTVYLPHVVDNNSFRAFLMESESKAFYTRIVPTFFIFIVTLLGEAQLDRSNPLVRG